MLWIGENFLMCCKWTNQQIWKKNKIKEKTKSIEGTKKNFKENIFIN